MLQPRWRKILRDLHVNKTRTILVMLSIAVGVFAVGMITGSAALLAQNLAENYAAINPADATIYIDSFDNELLPSVRRVPHVRDVAGRRTVLARLRVGHEEWRTLRLTAVDDFSDMPVSGVEPEQGAWPPPERTMLIERSSLGLSGARIGQQMTIKTLAGRERSVQIAGVAHDFGRLPTFFTGAISGYISFDTLEWLGEPRTYNELYLTVDDDRAVQSAIQAVAEQVRAKLEQSGYTVERIFVPVPGEHPMHFAIQAMLVLLSALGMLSLVLSAFLAVNTIEALLSREIRQIGVMKAIGARQAQMLGMYLGMVCCFGLGALVLSTPLSVLGARLTVAYVAGLLNFDLLDVTIPPHVFALQALTSMLVPLSATCWPIIRGTRITIRQALSGYGAGADQIRTGRFYHLLHRVGGRSRPLLITLHNIFRRKARLALTLTTLTLASAIFVAVFSTRDSTVRTTAEAQRYTQYDVAVELSRRYRRAEVVQVALRVPGVVQAEGWGRAWVSRLRSDGSESDAVALIAPPAETKLIQPIVLEGRWLLPQDTTAVVVNTELLRDEPDVHVGDTLTLKLGERETRWEVVGIVRGVLTGPLMYANYPSFTHTVRAVDQVQTVQLITQDHSPLAQHEVARQVEAQFSQAGIDIASVEPTVSIWQRAADQFNIIIVFLLIMAVMLALVGSLGLMGMMSMSVLERQREIGIMRAIGASDRIILQIVMSEGLLIGLLGWGLGVILAFPLGRILSQVVGIEFTRAPLSYSFSLVGALVWLGLSLIVAAAATYVPARQAARISIRAAISYE